jgi:hypothetical protein
MHLITVFRLYGIAIDLATTNLGYIGYCYAQVVLGWLEAGNSRYER